MALTSADIDRLSRRDPGLLPVLLAAATAGTVAAATSTGVLGLLAKLEGATPLQPVNATSHWVHGPEAGKVRGADLAHTGIGYATNHAAAIFWALPLTLWLHRGRRRSAGETVAASAATAAFAAAFDYGIVPRRLRPGWEHAVTGRSVAGGFVGLAAGLAAGSLIAQSLMRRI